MRALKLMLPAFGALALTAVPALAQEAEAAKPGLLTIDGGLMFWTLVVFAAIFAILAKFAFPAILGAVEAREEALTRAIADAKADRDAAAKVLADHQAQIEAARGDAQKIIADGRATAEAMKASMLEETRKQQQELLERARRDIEAEKVSAIADLRREAVGLAIAAAGRVIEKNLDDAQNQKLVEQYLASIK